MTTSDQAADLIPTMPALIGLAPLMRKAFAEEDMKPIAAALLERATNNSEDAHAYMDLATVLLLLGHRETALSTQMLALQTQALYRIPSKAIAKIKLLVLMTNGDLMANTPVEFLLEDSDIDLTLWYVGAGIPAIQEIPEHDVLLVAIGEADDKRDLLIDLHEILKNWHRPVLNLPIKIAELGRDRACHLLQPASEIAMPTAVRVSRQKMQELADGLTKIGDLIADTDFPIIARPLGSHAGQGLRKVVSADAVADYLQAVPVDEFYIARFVDYRSADGMFRKYRIMLINGQPFISHMGISTHWMIHYLNAGMTESAEKRVEEARFMQSFDTDFAQRHAKAFAEIHQRTGLDYVGIDCGETTDGKLLIFEVDSDMIVHAMDPIEMFPYKQEPMRKLFTAFRQLLLTTVSASHQTPN